MVKWCLRLCKSNNSKSATKWYSDVWLQQCFFALHARPLIFILFGLFMRWLRDDIGDAVTGYIIIFGKLIYQFSIKLILYEENTTFGQICEEENILCFVVARQLL